MPIRLGAGHRQGFEDVAGPVGDVLPGQTSAVHERGDDGVEDAGEGPEPQQDHRVGDADTTLPSGPADGSFDGRGDLRRLVDRRRRLAVPVQVVPARRYTGVSTPPGEMRLMDVPGD